MSGAVSGELPVSHGRLERIWIKRCARGPMDAVELAQMIQGVGLEGCANRGGARQVTVLASEAWSAAVADLGGQLEPSLRRANLFVSGIDLEASRGKVLQVGKCQILVRGETRPCERMDEAQRGLRDALRPCWRGGVYGEVLVGGAVCVGDPVHWRPLEPTE